MYSTSKIFKSLQGRWKLKRTIPEYGEMEGIATFSKMETEADALAYKEEGIFTLKSGEKLNAHREYVYRYSNDKIKAFFVENNKSDRLFHVLSFDNSTVNSESLTATASHQCINDNYHATYKFFNQNKFGLSYVVKGPKKDYVSNTIFTREQASLTEQDNTTTAKLAI